MSLRTKNLNLLPVLLALLEEESVVRAAERINLSQPATSGALARLRAEFGDQLLVRVGRTMQRTARGNELLPVVRQHCGELERLFDASTFEPSESHDRFVIAAPDHLAYLLTRELLGRLSVEAPNVRIQLTDVPLDLEHYLHEGMFDLAVCADFGAWPGLTFMPLMHERFVAAMSSDHPLAGRSSLRHDELGSYPGLKRGASVLRSGAPVSTGVPILDLEQQFTIGQFTDAVLLTLGTTYIAPAPEMLVNDLSANLPIVGVPFTPDDGVVAGMFWAPFQHDSPKFIWLRSVVAEAFAGAPPPRPAADIPASASAAKRRLRAD